MAVESPPKTAPAQGVSSAVSAEMQLERLRERISLVGRAAKVGIWEYDFERDELWVSDELAMLYGVEADEFTWPQFAARLHPDDRVPVLDRPTPSYPFGEVNEFLFRVRHTDGSYRSIRSRSATQGRDGVPIRKYGAHIDMSEDALLQLARLSKSNERLREFAYMASHDLRSPLRAISALLDVVVDQHGAELSGEARRLVDTVMARAGQLDQLLVDMLRYAAADLTETELDVVDIEDLIRSAVATTDHGQCRVVVQSDVPSPVPVAATPLGACIRNLVDNACKHHDKPAGTVAVSASQDGNHWLQIEVADDGPGIPPWLQEKLYQPFKTSDRKRGSGLGLAHVRTSVDKHNGSIDVVTGPTDGTTFTIRWPIANPTSS